MTLGKAQGGPVAQSQWTEGCVSVGELEGQQVTGSHHNGANLAFL